MSNIPVKLRKDLTYKNIFEKEKQQEYIIKYMKNFPFKYKG